MFCAAALAGCLWMAGWQWYVATAPAPAGVEVSVWRNYAYAVNWLIFAVVGVWFWWRLPRDQMRSEAADAGGVSSEGSQPGHRDDVSLGGESRGSGPLQGLGPPSGGVAANGGAVSPVGPAHQVNAPVDVNDSAGAEDHTLPVTRQQRFDPFSGA